MSPPSSAPPPRLVFLDLRSSYSHSSLALPLLERAVTAAGVAADWTRVSAVLADRPAVVAAQVVAAGPDLVLATAYLFTRPLLLAILRRVAALCPGLPIVLGGPEFLGDNEAFLRAEPWCRAVCRGEGETALARWLPRRDQPQAWDAVPGLCWLDPATGDYRDNGLARLTAAELAALPPAGDSPFFPADKPFVQLETSRGCGFGCLFCTSGRGGRPRLFPEERSRRELAAAAARGVADMRILDRTFNDDDARAARLLCSFLNDYPAQRFHLELHPGRLGPECRRVLAAAPPGRLHLEVGLQTTHPEALRACGRGRHPEADWEGLVFLRGLPGVVLHVDLLAGLPQLPAAAVEADVRRLVNLGVDEMQLETVKVLPGTALAARAATLGVTFAPDPPYEVLATSHCPAAELLRLGEWSGLLDNYYNPPALRPALRLLVAGHGAEVLGRLHARVQSWGGCAPGIALERRFKELAGLAAELGHAAARLALARSWLQAGYSPANCPAAEVQPWKGPLPPAVLAACPGPPAATARFWYLDLPDGQREWYILDRAARHASGHQSGPRVILLPRPAGA